MDIYVNEKKIDFTPGLPATWEGFIGELLSGKYIKGSHSLVKMTLDDIDSTHLVTPGKLQERIPGDIKVIKIFTEDSVAFARDGLTGIAPLIEIMKAEIGLAAAFYREGNIQQASAKIAAVMEEFRSVVHFINSVGMSFSLYFDTIMFDEKQSLLEKMDTSRQVFSDVVNAQIEKDYTKLADYLENQLVENMSEWNKIADIIIKEVETYES